MSHPYYTHRKYLFNSLNSLNIKDKINILEFGVGDGSSLLFHEFAYKNPNVNIKAFETDKLWIDQTKEKYSLSNYEFIFIDNWDTFLIEDNFKEDNYDLIFIDQSPWEARVKTMDLLIDKSKITILHDYDFFNKGYIEDIFDFGENSFFKKYISKNILLSGFHEELPPTLVFNKI